MIPSSAWVKKSARYSQRTHSNVQELLPELVDWHPVPEEWFGPRKSGHHTNKVAGDSGNFRNHGTRPDSLHDVEVGSRVLPRILSRPAAFSG
jgi:hypothetical protein